MNFEDSFNQGEKQGETAVQCIAATLICLIPGVLLGILGKIVPPGQFSKS